MTGQMTLALSSSMTRRDMPSSEVLLPSKIPKKRPGSLQLASWEVLVGMLVVKPLSVCRVKSTRRTAEQPCALSLNASISVISSLWTDRSILGGRLACRQFKKMSPSPIFPTVTRPMIFARGFHLTGVFVQSPDSAQSAADSLAWITTQITVCGQRWIERFI